MADPAAKLAAINARIAALYPGSSSAIRASSSPVTQATPRTHAVLSASVLDTVSEIGGVQDGSDGDTTTNSNTSVSAGSAGSTTIAASSTTTHKIKKNARPLCPSDVAEDLDIEFLDHKRRHRFPQCGITVKATSTSTYSNVRFVDCAFDSYEGTLFDDCVLDDVVFNKCHFKDTNIVKLIAKGARFTGCSFSQAHLEGITLVDVAAILDLSFAFERVFRGPAADKGGTVRISAIQEFEVVKQGKSQPSRQHGWAQDKHNKAVQGNGQLVEAPAYAGWENKVIKPATSGDLMSFEEPMTFEEGEAQARNDSLVSRDGLLVPATANWNRQFIREDKNVVKLVNREIEQPDEAKSFAPTNFVTLDWGADPETRKEEVSDDFQIGKREYYGTKKNKSKRFWAEKKAEQQAHRRRNIPGAPHYY